MKRKELLKRTLAGVLAAAMAFTLTPNVGLLFVPASVKAAATADQLITDVKANGVSAIKEDADDRYIVMGSNDKVKLDIDANATVDEVTVAVASTPTAPTEFQFDAKTNIITTKGVNPATTAVAKLTLTPDSGAETTLSIFIGKYKAYYYFKTLEEVNAAEKKGESVEPDAEAWMKYDTSSQQSTVDDTKPFIDLTQVDKIKKDGYKFAWTNNGSDEASATSHTIADTAIATGGNKFYALHTPISYYVIFDKNAPSGETVTNDLATANANIDGVDGNDDAMTVKYDEEKVLPGSVNYSITSVSGTWYFTGWNSKPDGSGDLSVDDLGTIKNLIPAKNLKSNNSSYITLYAQWAKYDSLTDYVINYYDKDGASSSQIYKKDIVKKDAINEYKLDREAYEPVPGKEFVGWCDKSNKTEPVKNFPFVEGEHTYNLYAKYSPITYTIKLDSNGGNTVGTIDNLKEVYDTDFKSDLNTIKTKFSRDNYALVSNKEFALDKYGIKEIATNSDVKIGDVIPLDAFDETNTVILYANWKGETYKINYNLNNALAVQGDVPNDNATTVEYGKTISITENEPTLDKNVFIGWNTKADGSGETYLGGADFNMNEAAKALADSSKVITLYAMWQEGYKVEYKNQDADGKDSIIYSEIVGKDYTKNYSVKLPSGYENPQLDGYTFVGWIDSGNDPVLNGTGAKTTIPTISGPVTLWPVFAANKVIVSYEANAPEGKEASGTTASAPLDLNNTKTLAANGFSVPGYAFVGWNTKADGSGVAYGATADMEEYLLATDSVESTLTLYAQWAVPYYYIANSAGVDEDNLVVSYGITAEELEELLTKKVYIGLGETADEQTIKEYYKDNGYFTITWDIEKLYTGEAGDYKFGGKITLVTGAVANDTAYNPVNVFVNVTVSEQAPVKSINKLGIVTVDNGTAKNEIVKKATDLIASLEGVEVIDAENNKYYLGFEAAEGKDIDSVLASYDPAVETEQKFSAVYNVTGGEDLNWSEFTGDKVTTLDIVVSAKAVNPEPTPVNPEPEVNPTPVTPEPEVNPTPGTDTTTGSSTDVTPSGSGSGSGGGGGSSNAKTVKNADGSTTTTTTTAKGTIETTTKTNADGSKTTSKVVKNKDGSGSVTETSVSAAGTTKVVEVVTDATGAATEVTTTVSNSKGASMKVTYAAKGTAITVSKVETTGKTAVSIPATVKVGGKTYKVTKIAASALKGNKEITKVTLGKNVKSIGKNAFNGDSKLKSIVMKKAPTTVGKNAFKGIAKKATIKIKATKKAFKTAKKLIKKSGIASTVKIKRTK